MRVPVCERVCVCALLADGGQKAQGGQKRKGDPLASWGGGGKESRRNEDQRDSGLGERRPDLTRVIIVPVCLRFSQR